MFDQLSTGNCRNHNHVFFMLPEQHEIARKRSSFRNWCANTVSNQFIIVVRIYLLTIIHWVHCMAWVRKSEKPLKVYYPLAIKGYRWCHHLNKLFFLAPPASWTCLGSVANHDWSYHRAGYWIHLSNALVVLAWSTAFTVSSTVICRWVKEILIPIKFSRGGSRM